MRVNGGGAARAVCDTGLVKVSAGMCRSLTSRQATLGPAMSKIKAELLYAV